MTAEQKAQLWEAIKAIPANSRRTEIFTFGTANWYADKLNSTVYVCSNRPGKWVIEHIFSV